jgi:hypothetical protein
MAQTYFQPFYNEPGITRDGTLFDSQTYVDGQWVRFYKKKPKKMGGYKAIANDYDQIVRTIESFHIGNEKYLVCGTATGVSISKLGADEKCGAKINITPVSFTPNEGSVWSFDFVFCKRYDPNNPDKPISARSYLLAHVAPNIGQSSNTTFGTVYYWEVSQSNIDTAIPLYPVLDYQTNLDTPQPIQCTGSITVIGSYILAFGNNGEIRWNNGENLNAWCVTAPPKQGIDDKPNKVSSLGGGAVIFGAENFISAFPFRLGSSLGGLIWSTTAVVTVALASPVDLDPKDDSSASTNVNFTFSYTSTLSTCLSPTSVCSIEPLFFWVGLNTFYMFNGSITEVVNETNKLFFFENLNQAQATKIYSFVNLRYHEWWILFPKGTSTECNHALIYNYEYQCWYDTPIDRAAAIRYGNILYHPVLTSSVIIARDNSYPVYLHEIGVNAVAYSGNKGAIPSFITAYVSKELGADIASKAIIMDRIIYDLKQSGKMTCTVFSLSYPRTPPTEKTFNILPDTQTSTMNIKATILAVQFLSDEVDGDYHLGKTLIEYIITDELRASGGDFRGKL